ncbi:MAG: hypothetical protein MJZ26_09240 [Fibrobacter sp.]|nr:hypothetical protein [Fibrobacter sp.]
MTREEKIQQIATKIFQTLYAEHNWGETAAWNQAYKRAIAIVNREEKENK